MTVASSAGNFAGGVADAGADAALTGIKRGTGRGIGSGITINGFNLSNDELANLLKLSNKTQEFKGWDMLSDAEKLNLSKQLETNPIQKTERIQFFNQLDVPRKNLYLQSLDSKLIIEILDSADNVNILQVLDSTESAKILNKLEPDEQVKQLKKLDQEKSTDIFGKMPTDQQGKVSNKMDPQMKKDMGQDVYTRYTKGAMTKIKAIAFLAALGFTAAMIAAAVKADEEQKKCIERCKPEGFDSYKLSKSEIHMKELKWSTEKSTDSDPICKKPEPYTQTEILKCDEFCNTLCKESKGWDPPLVGPVYRQTSQAASNIFNDIFDSLFGWLPDLGEIGNYFLIIIIVVIVIIGIVFVASN